jgi:hypothetical protein
MDKRKRMVILLIVVICVVAVLLFIKNRNTSNKNLADEFSSKNSTINKKNTNAFRREATGKIKTIDKNILVIIDANTPIKDLTKDKAGIEFSLKTSQATIVFFTEKGKQQRKALTDLRVGDAVNVEYDNLTKEVNAVTVLVSGL